MARGELLLDTSQQWELAGALIEHRLFGIKSKSEDYITLKSERRSPHYLDIRLGLSSYAARQAVSGTMKELYMRRPTLLINTDYIVGSPEAMTSYATSIADRLRMGLLQPRVAQNKARGNKAPTLGRYEEGQAVAAFDDVLTDGETKIDTINMLQGAGLVVHDYFVVLDREEGGYEQVDAATGIQITPALGISSLTRMLRNAGDISRRQYDNVARYLTEYGEPHAQEAMNSAL